MWDLWDRNDLYDFAHPDDLELGETLIPEVRMNEDLQALKEFCDEKGYTSPLILVNIETGRVIECKAFDVENEVWVASDELGAFWVERYPE